VELDPENRARLHVTDERQRGDQGHHHIRHVSTNECCGCLEVIVDQMFFHIYI